MALGDSDVRRFFGTGDPVSCEGVSTYADGQPIQAFVENVGADAVFEQSRVTDAVIRAELPWNAFASNVLVEGAYFRVLAGRNAGNYKIRSVNPVDDGATLELKLRKL
jgi:hypothetical protein